MAVINNNTMDNLTLEVSQLLISPLGTTEAYSLDQPNLKGKIEIMKVEDGLNVVILEMKTKEDVKCEYCLKEFKQDIEFEDGERRFLTKAPENELDPFESFSIDVKAKKIDLSDMIRQEIILHFPAISVCSTHCKGICPHCGKDRNVEKCNCKEVKVEKPKPLSALKDLIK